MWTLLSNPSPSSAVSETPAPLCGEWLLIQLLHHGVKETDMLRRCRDETAGHSNQQCSRL